MGEVAMQGNSIWGYEIHWKYPQYAYWNDGLNKTQANTIPLFFGSPPHGKALLLGWIIYCVQ
jgi:hypothetical protein